MLCRAAERLGRSWQQRRWVMHTRSTMGDLQLLSFWLCGERKRCQSSILMRRAHSTSRTKTATSGFRDVWAKAGVLVNELARPALFLNLSMKRHPTLPIVAGEPTYASLRVLLRSNPSWDVSGLDVYVCENADSDDLARVYRFDLAQDSEMISPTIPI